MSFITKRSLSRRTVLRGLGATIALPLLDSMVPALTAATKTAAKPIRRLGCIYVPNGMEMRMWTPKSDGAGYALSPILEPLKPFYDQSIVMSGLADRVAVPLPGEGIGDHARASSTWLTGVHVKKTEGPDIRAGVSMDQIAAQVLGKETQLASLELALDSVEVLGACDAGYSCAYANTISWRTATTPLPMENDPRAVFERLFGASNSTDAATRLARIKQEKTILDVVTEEIGALSRTLGSNDRQRLSEYLEAVRDVERRIQTAEAQHDRELPVLDQPQGIPDSFEKHIQLMYDLMALAYQADLTRVATFMISREVSSPHIRRSGCRMATTPVRTIRTIRSSCKSWLRSTLITSSSSPTSWTNCGTRPTGTATCWIIQCSSTARASATAPSISTWICRCCWSAAPPVSSRADDTFATRTTHQSRTCMYRCSTSWAFPPSSSEIAPAGSNT